MTLFFISNNVNERSVTLLVNAADITAAAMKKKEIIEAAFRVWGRDFYYQTSLSSLAAELGVCKPALYRHFISKSVLLEAMNKHFFDEFAAFIKESYEKALQHDDISEGVFILIRAVSEYFARNVNRFIFSMIKFRENGLNSKNMIREMRLRGVDFELFHNSVKKSYNFSPIVMSLIFSTLTFYIARFHKAGDSLTKQPKETAIFKIIKVICDIIGNGLGYSTREIDALNYEKTEKKITMTKDSIKDDPLLKAVAGAVAEAGPWKASMEQVAKRSGLSKSSLYCHFESRQDMMYQLFKTETLRIIDFARQGIKKSAVPIEQLYLGIFSITEYLRLKPDILAALDWLRNRKLNHADKNHHKPMPEALRLFDEVDIHPLSDSKSPFHKLPSLEKGTIGISPWILILIVNTLMRNKTKHNLKKVPVDDIRFLFRFITLGIGGFKNNEEWEEEREQGAGSR